MIDLFSEIRLKDIMGSIFSNKYLLKISKYF